jgi:hypothetical protein
MTPYALRRAAKRHPRMFPLVLGLMVGGLAIATGLILSNILVYPGTVAGRVTLSSPVLPANNTTIHWFVGLSKNVSVTVQPNGFTGTAHIVYEIDAPGIVCTNVTLTPVLGSNDTATCTAGTNSIQFITDSKSFNGQTNRFWKYMMVFNSVFSSIVLKIYVADG